jgi:hypothetical protein
MTYPLTPAQEQKLINFVTALVDQQKARVIVPAMRPESGFWFGGGNMVQHPRTGELYVVGRYRNAGDSRTGLGLGERGAELAIFRSDDDGANWRKVVSFSKADLNLPGREVVSIEGSALHFAGETGAVELFVSTEKKGIAYPPGLESHLKPGTGVWTIERLAAPSIEQLKTAPIATVLESADPEYLHIKDPFVHETPAGDLTLLFCSHPYSWSSSNTGYAIRRKGSERFEPAVYDFFRRGTTWDVAMTRGTCVLDVPRVGAFGDETVSVMFYDGGECLRPHEQHAQAVRRPRGYSCEEIGGAAYVEGAGFSRIRRLSRTTPLFVSPHGTGCSRYVDVLKTSTGYHVTWQQSQPDQSQPLVMNTLSHPAAQRILS